MENVSKINNLDSINIVTKTELFFFYLSLTESSIEFFRNVESSVDFEAITFSVGNNFDI